MSHQPDYADSVASSASSSSSSTSLNKPSKDSIEPLISQVFGHLKSAASTVNQLTSQTLSESQQSLMKESIDHIYATMNEMRQRHGAVTTSSSEQAALLARAASSFASSMGGTFSIPSSDPNSTSYEYSDIDDLEMDMENLTDKYLENVDRFLMEHQKLKGKHVSEPKFVKPQTKWKNKPNNANSVFVPKLAEKPNALVPLEEVLAMRQDFDASVESFPYTRHGFGLGGDVRRDSYPHPYLPEIQSFKFREDQLKPCSPQIIKSMEEVPCTWVDSKQKLLELVALLDSQMEFAIDLEHHSFRTYQGFCCLMQISTRTEDFLIDVVELRDDLHLLNSSFTNPNIVKVMHGADCDILWLQRDFGLYIVNMFDTGQAARVLGLSPAYAYILPHYCNINPDKKYQLADWRLRPLPSVMISYARADTHFLLYIYDRLRNDIFDQKNGKEGLISVLEKSRQICMRRYEKFVYDESSYLYLRRKFPQGITEEEDNILRELFKWRDQIARENDESVRFVLPDDTLVFVATKKPNTTNRLLSVCSPPSRLVKENCEHIVQLIQKATRGEVDPAELITETPTRDPAVAQTPGRDSPILDLSQLCQKAHWFSKPDMIQSVSFDTPDEMMIDSTPHRAPNTQSNVFVPQAIQSSFYNSSFNTVQTNTHWKQPPTPGQDLMDLYSPSAYAKPTPAANLPARHPVLPDQPQEVPEQPKFLDKHHFETPILTPPPAKNVDDRTPPEERVPKSLHEIYRLSQQNRKRNKQKKKLKQSSVTDPRPAYSAPAAKSPTETVEDPKEFMDQIGWRVKSPSQDSMQVSPANTSQQDGNHQQKHQSHSNAGGNNSNNRRANSSSHQKRNNRKKTRGR
uniref:HRDC domain-containing protein n=1 Tax=Percolomonas cosmopolitus TaxID=63605 RepID=A0A7S1KUD1_9EUKA|mmetsp:Transcript_9416/g.34960  ORF Transcript_9416/g.34960 Transcript_9416/m.34960 type:complete len:855 (+) Transcript_9416:319-2883(+)|eukprot:CAMPEP_0117444316 /NCGR_PEP_ID=MMETSP0759-20121206/5175_1 /TAXON_ID=63605 /ORGANISM="Percolomonas cosmopolitus, Strain WS" /LENGTH=854 /DNA_ID=CAMNT_0005236373 /DNA_START=307 /DNA_END=2871 /DNA_ORIENTATION=+